MPRQEGPIFKSRKRIRLGMWGLGRGAHFFRALSALNIDVAAGCDFNEHMRDRFRKLAPDAQVTGDAAEFLKGDFDAVLLATYCPAHADDAIACLRAGKHVLSEVTAFHTLAEGVRLVEEVEKSGKVYNLAENYPFSAANMYLARRWKEGLFGDLMYAEYEYVHECRSLVYTYIDDEPVAPGWTVHNWRSWLHFHYYNTHSLGPVMHITGARPVRVTALPGSVGLAGYLLDPELGMGGVAPSLIQMDNGGLMRNLMGATTNDSHVQRLWGSRGSAELIDGRLRLRLGAAGLGTRMEVVPKWKELGARAAAMGHGGGDFWTMYYFAREVLFGEPAPFDIYAASDCTIPGILAYRSARAGGRPFDVPDFRRRKDRDRSRRDHFAQPRYDVEKGCFPRGADRGATGRFTAVMKDLVRHAVQCRAFLDGRTVAESSAEPQKLIDSADAVLRERPAMTAVFREARRLASAYPGSDGARVIREMLDIADDRRVTRRGFPAEVRKARRRFAALARKVEAERRRRS
jgi:predicted dehydrogenase